MQAKKTPIAQSPAGAEQPAGFDVIVRRSIGRVEFDSTGEHSPFEAAMLLIGRDGESGQYEFPASFGGFVHVSIAILPVEARPPEGWEA